jgi:hypothetical protein
MNDSTNTITAAEALSKIESRIHRAQAIVAVTAAAAGGEQGPRDKLDLQYTLEAASELFLGIASDIFELQRRVQWVPKTEEVQR